MTGATQPPPLPPLRVDRVVPECPYVGLVPFEESDAPYFFGRERERDLIVANLTVSRLTLLYAASGVGKSSVLQAGVLPQLQQIAGESAADLGIPGAAVGYVREWSPDLDPLDTIATAVLGGVSRVPGARPVEEGEPARLSLPWLRDEVLQHSGVEAVYLVLDQFEEYFLYHPADPGTDGLADALGQILSTRDLPVNVLVSIREDALAALDRFKGWVPRLYDNYLRLAHLGSDAAQTAIEGPLEHYNQVAPDPDMTVERGLTDALLDQVRTRHLAVVPDEGAASGGAAEDRDDIEAPYLQLVLTRLWDAERARGSSVLRRSTLEELGGVQKIVQNHLDTVMAGLSPEQTEVAAAIFHHLVTPSGLKIAQRAEDLAELSRMPVSSVQELLQSLSAGQRRILRPVPPPAGVAGPGRYEIFHDVMGAAVLNWRRRYLAQRAQAEASRKLVAEREKAEAEREKAQAEQEKAQAEARATRRQLRKILLLAASLAVVLLIAVVFGVFFYSERLLSASTADRYEDPAKSLREAVDAYHIRDDETTREAVLMAASIPRGTVIAGRPGEPKVAGMMVTRDQRQVVTYDAQGGIHVISDISDQGQVTKTVKASHLTGTVSLAATNTSASQVALATDQGSIAVITIGTGKQTNLVTDGSDRSPISTIWWLESPPEDLILVRNSSGRVSTYSATDGHWVTRLPDLVYWARPTADDQILTSDHDLRLRVWNPRTGAQVAESSPLAAPAENLQPYAHEAIGVTDNHNLITWDWHRQAGPEPRQYPLALKTFTLVTMNEATHTVAIVADKAVSIYRLNDGLPQRSLPQQPNWLRDVEWDPSGRWIATAGDDGVRVWRMTGNGTLGRATYEFIVPGGVQRVSFLGDGQSLVFLGVDRTVRFWDLPRIRRVDLGDWVRNLDVSADGRWLAAASADGTVHIVDPTGPLNVSVPVVGHVGNVRFDPKDAHRVITLSWYKTQPQAWRWGSGREAKPSLEFEKPSPLVGSVNSSYLTSLDISGDGTRVAAEAYDGSVYLWDAHTGKLIDKHPVLGSSSHSAGNSIYVPAGVAFDPCGTMLAAASPTGIRLTTLDTSREISCARQTREEPTTLDLPGATYVAFDQSGEYLVGAAGDRGVLRVWTRDGQLVHEFRAQGRGTVGRPSFGRFGRDGRLVAVGTGEGRIQVWDVGSGRTVLLTRQHGGLVNDVLFLPALPGRPSRLASASDDSTVAVFPCEACDDPDAVIQKAQDWVRANPN